MRTTLRAVLALAALLPACVAGADGKEEESALPEEGAADSFRSPTDHGDLAFGVGAPSVLTDDARYHTWTFDLSGPAQVKLTTSYALLGQRRTDTVLYLYKEGPTGWGPYIARNDDYGTTTYSQLIRSLGAGRYRALVKGYLDTTRGKFKLTIDCAGEGCQPATPTDACLFGTTYGELLEDSPLTIVNQNLITAETLGWLLPEDQERLLLAVKESAHRDVTTPAEAIARVDQGQVNVTWFHDDAGRRGFISFEYGAGDNSYGAVFDRTDGAMAAAIHDGDLYDCVATAETCLLPEDDVTLRTDAAFGHATVRVVTSASGLSPAEAAQVLAALRGVYGDGVATVADGLAMADGRRVNLRPITHLATGTALTVVEFGAGDTSVGAVFFGDTTTQAATIRDLTIDDCTFFAP
ncbi:MAG: hypothetical protein R2939_19830 [Kofleriaceae bacterium]